MVQPIKLFILIFCSFFGRSGTQVLVITLQLWEMATRFTNSLPVGLLRKREELIKRKIRISVAQPFYTRGTLNIVEESWRHTNPILNIFEKGGGGVMDVVLSNSI
jgi:hypothetical protein